jgi:hypothetical protein
MVGGARQIKSINERVAPDVLAIPATLEVTIRDYNVTASLHRPMTPDRVWFLNRLG